MTKMRHTSGGTRLSNQQLWESVCLLEETICLLPPRLSQATWQPGTSEVAYILSAGPTAMEIFSRYACMQPAQQQQQQHSTAADAEWREPETR